MMNDLSGFVHGQFFISVVHFGRGLAACKDFHVAKRAKDELNDILHSLGSAACIIVVRARALPH